MGRLSKRARQRLRGRRRRRKAPLDAFPPATGYAIPAKGHPEHRIERRA